MKPRLLALVAGLVGATALTAFLVAGSAGTGSTPNTDTSAYKVVAAGDIAADDPIPFPRKDPVLSIAGLVSNPNDGKRIRIDMAALERMPSVRLRVYEPFEERDMTFDGVLVSDLLRIVGADATARTLHIEALDDYKVDLPLAEIFRSHVLLATSVNGKSISIANGGPTRIIFPPDSSTGRNLDMWIWNVESMFVR